MQVTNKFIDLNNYVFTFGKHKNRAIRDVIDEEASYVVWCHKNVESFVLTDVDYHKVLKEMDRQDNVVGDAGYWKDDFWDDGGWGEEPF